MTSQLKVAHLLKLYRERFGHGPTWPIPSRPSEAEGKQDILKMQLALQSGKPVPGWTEAAKDRKAMFEADRKAMAKHDLLIQY